MRFLVYFIVTVFFYIPNATAVGAIIEQAPLDFGTIAITDNTAVRTLRVRYTGQIIRDPEILLVIPGSPAEYLITGFPPSQSITVTITNLTGIVFSPYANVLNEKFTISNFDYISFGTTDASGEFTFFVGAVLRTSGSGTYEDNIYLGTMNVEVNVTF